MYTQFKQISMYFLMNTPELFRQVFWFNVYMRPVKFQFLTCHKFAIQLAIRIILFRTIFFIIASQIFSTCCWAMSYWMNKWLRKHLKFHFDNITPFERLTLTVFCDHYQWLFQVVSHSTEATKFLNSFILNTCGIHDRTNFKHLSPNTFRLTLKFSSLMIIRNKYQNLSLKRCNVIKKKSTFVLFY